MDFSFLLFFFQMGQRMNGTFSSTIVAYLVLKTTNKINIISFHPFHISLLLWDISPYLIIGK